MRNRYRYERERVEKEYIKEYIEEPDLLADFREDDCDAQTGVWHDTRSEADRLMDDTLDRGRNALMTAVQTKEMTAETLQELDKQGEQIKNAQRGVDTILHDTDKAKRSAQSISSSFWTFIQKFTSPAERQDHVNIEIKQKASGKQQEMQASRARTVTSTAVMIETMANSSFQEKMRASDAMLDQLSNQLDDLQGMALDMQVTLDEQNQRLDILNDTSAQANEKLDDVIDRTDRILGKR